MDYDVHSLIKVGSRTLLFTFQKCHHCAAHHQHCGKEKSEKVSFHISEFLFVISIFDIQSYHAFFLPPNPLCEPAFSTWKIESCAYNSLQKYKNFLIEQIL